LKAESNLVFKAKQSHLGKPSKLWICRIIGHNLVIKKKNGTGRPLTIWAECKRCGAKGMGLL